jgi:hypothetical protein
VREGGQQGRVNGGREGIKVTGEGATRGALSQRMEGR